MGAQLTHDVASPIVVRGVCLYFPILVLAALWLWRRPDSRMLAGLLLACVWNASYLLALNVVALHFGWWDFSAQGGFLYGVPVDLWIGWMILWGAISALAFPKARSWVVLIIFGLIDLLFMPRLAPVLQLGPHWLFGEALGLVFCLLPSLLLARWTAEKKNLSRRVTLQFFAFSAMSMGLLPAMVLEASGGSWARLWMRSLFSFSIWAHLLAVPAVMGLSAMQEFMQCGCGTPLPYDPPERLVTSGVYAYIANPMQTGSTLLLIGLGALLESWWVVALGMVAGIYSLGVAGWDESSDLAPRFGEHWREYRKHVKPWRIRWRPWDEPRRRSRIYISQTCAPCSEVYRWFAARNLNGLRIIAGEEHPEGDLTRITYDPGDGTPEESGVAALARGLEHVNFAWAFLGFVMRLPVVRPLLQLLIDVSGGEARPLSSSDPHKPRPTGVRCR